MKKLILSESAVSEAMSFSLTLAIVILASAMVYFQGAPMLDKSEKTAHFQEMERSFLYLSQNIGKVGADRAPIRITELKIKGGILAVRHNSSITIGSIPFNLGSVEYMYEDKTLAYENGGIWTKYPNGAVIIVSKPSFSTGNTTTIPAFELAGDYWVGGDGIMRVNGKIFSSSLLTVDAVNGNVSMVIQSDYYKGWAEYLGDIGAKDIVIDDMNTTVSSNITANVVNVDSSQIITSILTG
ncbi:MAG: hypothetical protein O8C66_11175 [Candidatus Methanoperedens sp.]|nr:hypothetical protein [Candidatus Methanoperedens sp.]MCZ7371061.1 hypothetical protein [Candidatus Methanoperedens sp.]